MGHASLYDLSGWLMIMIINYRGSNSSYVTAKKQNRMHKISTNQIDPFKTILKFYHT